MIYNQTPFTLDEISGFKVLGKCVNNWRKRNVTLYQHPTEVDNVVSVGIAFDGSKIVICSETKSDWGIALDYAANGKVYVLN